MLPPEILYYIFDFLEWTELVSIRCSCKYFYLISDEKQIQRCIEYENQKLWNQFKKVVNNNSKISSSHLSTILSQHSGTVAAYISITTPDTILFSRCCTTSYLDKKYISELFVLILSQIQWNKIYEKCKSRDSKYVKVNIYLSIMDMLNFSFLHPLIDEVYDCKISV